MNEPHLRKIGQDECMLMPIVVKCKLDLSLVCLVIILLVLLILNCTQNCVNSYAKNLVDCYCDLNLNEFFKVIYISA